jgi:hypothetical protein
MSFTRFRDDPDRIKKQLQQSTDVGRYTLNVPGPGDKPLYMEDPYIRAQMWGGNIMTNSVDIEAELFGLSRKLNRDSVENYHHADRASLASRTNEMIRCPTRNGSAVEQSRATHPAWMLRDAERDNWKMLHFDPQENVFMPFFNNLNTRVIEKDRFVPQTTVPGLSDDTYFAVHPVNMNPAAAERSAQLEGMVGGRRINEQGCGLGKGFVAQNESGIHNVGDMRQFSGTSTLFS